MGEYFVFPALTTTGPCEPLTDAKGILTGRFALTVRKPVATLRSGRPVLGIADAVVLNDPITGQARTTPPNARRPTSTRSWLGAGTVRRGLDAADLDRYWSGAQHVTAWTNALLAPPPAHVLELLSAAQQYPAIASRFVNGFDNPPDFAEWFLDPGQAARYLADPSPEGVRHETDRRGGPR